jgi:hypothetical protein
MFENLCPGQEKVTEDGCDDMRSGSPSMCQIYLEASRCIFEKTITLGITVLVDSCCYSFEDGPESRKIS